MKYSRDWLEAEFRKKPRMKFVFFWGHQPSRNGAVEASCLSQWWPSRFTIDGQIYTTSEQWMMAAKARLFKDHAIADRILQAKSPKEIKALGRLVSGFDEAMWVQHRYAIVLQGTVQKFEQNPELKRYLIGTGSKIIAEASPVDRIWGIGLAQDDPHADNPLKWNGDNLLGFSLMEARDQIS
jgi:ribA/ribD-fused uncharacterized protein